MEVLELGGEADPVSWGGRPHQTHSGLQQAMLAGRQLSTMTSFSDYYYLNMEKNEERQKKFVLAT